MDGTTISIICGAVAAILVAIIILRRRSKEIVEPAELGS
jgi:hypothetical protein